jgi:hypothetical protein
VVNTVQEIPPRLLRFWASSIVRYSKEHNVSKTGFVSVLRWKGERNLPCWVWQKDLTWVQWLRLGLSLGRNRDVPFILSPEDGNRSNFRNVVFSRVPDDKQNKKLSNPNCYIYYRQKPLESTRNSPFGDLFFCLKKSRSQWPRHLRYELFHPLEHCDRMFESHSRHGCLFAFILCLCSSVCR